MINIHEAKTHFSKLVEAAMQGREVIIAKAGKPAVKLVSMAALKPKRKPGALKGKIHMSTDFNAPLPDDMLDAFESK